MDKPICEWSVSDVAIWLRENEFMDSHVEIFQR